MVGRFTAMKTERQYSNIKADGFALGAAGALYGVGLLALAAARSLMALFAAFRAAWFCAMRDCAATSRATAWAAALAFSLAAFRAAHAASIAAVPL